MNFELVVPHYRRVEKLKKLSSTFLNQDYVKKMLVIDDSGLGFEKKHFGINNDRIKFIINKNNKGYARTFLSLFRESSAEYIIYTADDDEIISENFASLQKYIIEENPTLAITPYLENKKIVSGVEGNRSITLDNAIRHLTHTPGLVFCRRAFLPYLDKVEDLVLKGNQAALLYPQVLLIILALTDLKVSSIKTYKYPVVKGCNNLPSNLTDSSNNGYSSLNSRLLQFKDFYEAIVNLGINEKYFKSFALVYFRHVFNAIKLSKYEYISLIMFLIKKIIR
jgi:glycosyltransferase involved in cell wall biosynthesis